MSAKTGTNAFLFFILLGGLCSFAVQSDSVEDRDISRHLENEFLTDTNVPSDSIDIETNNGIVALRGSTGNILAKERAENIAAATVGVRGVINRIEVKPGVDIPDPEIKESVEEALLLDPATESYEVDVQVDDGTVILSGRVTSSEEKQLCATVAKSAEGVAAVENNIVVDFTVEPSDSEIEEAIEKRLINDVRVDDKLVKVRVEDSEVYLTGMVGSLQEKRRARDDARVSGVKDVHVDGLDIEWWGRDTMQRKDLMLSRTDEAIKEAVLEAFSYDPRVERSSVNVDVDDSTVTLSGIVDNLKSKMAAEKDAKNTTGVTSVVNHIKVRPSTAPSNEELKTAVKKALAKDPYVAGPAIKVTAQGGLVCLSGKLNTSWERRRAGEIARGVSGAVRVTNTIDYEYEWTQKPDWEIERDVRAQMQWSTFVNEEDIRISVDNGVATLDGVVNNYSQWKMAELNAFEGGAKEVVNRLVATLRRYGPDYTDSAFAE